ncbi:formyltransferase family protein [Dasania sp. GY-19]|uniref:Formyltransferase family protein n=1 Tax=Dasania phycosphaerae TaxID=2950436 RepID=A0A9J6RS63_9GAMM|nr:formyltransferase family protein [Dasania phycosphaerae]MCZ0867210.1 formyltransferase family protein [Dasania phycosphaerae]
MKIAYFGYNAFSSCLDVFVSHGHTLEAIFTGDSNLHADKVIDYAKKNDVPLFFERPGQEQMTALVQAGVDVFFAAEYPWKIPIPENLNYAINVHPTLLPEGRGSAPLTWLILRNKRYAGITFHKMTGRFDSGAILLQKGFPLSKGETFETLFAKLFIEVPILLHQLLSNLDFHYQNSIEQVGRASWCKITPIEQSVDWSQTTRKISRQMRAFGQLGIYINVAGQQYLVTSFEGVEYRHCFACGEIIYSDQLRVVVAAKDGLIVIPRTSLFKSQSTNYPPKSSAEIKG